MRLVALDATFWDHQFSRRHRSLRRFFGLADEADSAHGVIEGLMVQVANHASRIDPDIPHTGTSLRNTQHRLHLNLHLSFAA